MFLEEAPQNVLEEKAHIEIFLGGVLYNFSRKKAPHWGPTMFFEEKAQIHNAGRSIMQLHVQKGICPILTPGYFIFSVPFLNSKSRFWF